MAPWCSPGPPGLDRCSLGCQLLRLSLLRRAELSQFMCTPLNLSGNSHGLPLSMGGRSCVKTCAPAQYDWKRTWPLVFSWGPLGFTAALLGVNCCAYLYCGGRRYRIVCAPRPVSLETPMASRCAPGLPWPYRCPLGSWVSINVYISSVKGGGIANVDHPAPYDWKRPRCPGAIP